MKKWRQRSIEWILIVGAMFFITSSVLAEPKCFQYIFSNKYGDVVFRDELAASTVGNMKHFRAEFDNLGRLMNYATIVNGRPTSTNVVFYSGDSKFYTEFVYYDATGEKKNVTKIMRTPSGERIRREYFTVSGEMTSYTTYQYFSDRYETANFTVDHKLTGKYRTYFDNRNIVYKEIRFPINEDAYYISFFDGQTGLTTSQDKYEKGKHTVHSKFIYNENHMLIRRDLYDPLNNHNWYGANDYHDDLVVGKRYRFRNGATQEIKIEYGKDRNSTQSWLYYNNKLVCRFIYERKANGSIIRTVAYDGSGDLMAEYPNKMVDHINHDGSPLDGGEYKIYKKPVW